MPGARRRSPAWNDRAKNDLAKEDDDLAATAKEDNDLAAAAPGDDRAKDNLAKEDYDLAAAATENDDHAAAAHKDTNLRARPSAAGGPIRLRSMAGTAAR